MGVFQVQSKSFSIIRLAIPAWVARALLRVEHFMPTLVQALR